MTSADFTIILPEIALAVYAMAALLFGVYTTKDKAAPLLVWTTSAVLVAVAIWVGLSGEGTQQAFGGLFSDPILPSFRFVPWCRGARNRTVPYT